MGLPWLMRKQNMYILLVVWPLGSRFFSFLTSRRTCGAIRAGGAWGLQIQKIPRFGACLWTAVFFFPQGVLGRKHISQLRRLFSFSQQPYWSHQFFIWFYQTSDSFRFRGFRITLRFKIFFFADQETLNFALHIVDHPPLPSSVARSAGQGQSLAEYVPRLSQGRELL